MKSGEILSFLNEIAPPGYADDWDNVGLMIGGLHKQVNKILVCLDVTSKVIDEAIQNEADMIISHHPLLFSKISRIDTGTLKGRQIDALIKNDICVVSAHTNLDFATGGVDDTLAETLGLTGYRNLKPYVPAGYNVDLGMGRIGELGSVVSFEEFLSRVKSALSVTNVRMIGNRPNMVKRVAVFCGSFDGDLMSIKGQEADVLVTGDIKYHTALDAREMGLCIIDAGHFGTEHIIVGKLKSDLTKRFNNIDIICSSMESDPFIYT